MTTAYISFGSNIEPRRNLARAMRLLARRLPVTGVSTVYRTPPELARRQPDYYNCVAAVSTDLPPEELQYGLLRELEAQLGRKRSKDKFASRTIDLDVISYGSLRRRSRGLVLPAPELRERAYLAAGLAELGGPAKTQANPASARLRPLQGYTRFLRKELEKWNRTFRE